MDIIETIDTMFNMISAQYKLSREDTMKIVTYALGTQFVYEALVDKIGRLIKEGFFEEE